LIFLWVSFSNFAGKQRTLKLEAFGILLMPKSNFNGILLLCFRQLSLKIAKNKPAYQAGVK
jgi:hypothetical protein